MKRKFTERCIGIFGQLTPDALRTRYLVRLGHRGQPLSPTFIGVHMNLATAKALLPHEGVREGSNLAAYRHALATMRESTP